MTFLQPWLLVAALLALAAAVTWYLRQRRRRSARRATTLPYLFFGAGLLLLAIALGRPQATIGVSHTASTVVLALDVSYSMSATDVEPSRLASAQQAAVAFVETQPDTVDIGVVAFGTGGLTVLQPTAVHTEAIEAINRLSVSGDTSLGQAILTALSTIVGEQVTLPVPEGTAGTPEGTAGASDLGYWPAATIMVLSDGETTTGPDAQAAAALAATAGIRIDTIGIGTAAGAVIEVEGYQVATALDDQALTAIAQTTGGSYVPAGDAARLQQVYLTLDQRTTVEPQPVELTAVVAALAVLALTAGGIAMLRTQGRLV